MSRQPQVGGLFKRDIHVHSSSQTAPLSLSASEDLELGYGQRYSIDDQIIKRIVGTAGCSADVHFNSAMAVHLR